MRASSIGVTLAVALCVMGAAACDGDDPTDAGPMVDDDAGPGGDVDAGPAPDDAGDVDASGVEPGVIVVDGVVNPGEWPAAAMRVTQSKTTDFGEGLNELSAVTVYRDADNFYMAVEGLLEPVNAWVVYLDVDRALMQGADNPTDLTDTTGLLDDALSQSETADPADFFADRAWGTLGLDRTAEEFDERTGWRELSNVGDLGWLTGLDNPTVCGANACETRINLAALGSDASTPISLYVQLVNMDGSAVSNQALPETGDNRLVVENVITLDP